MKSTFEMVDSIGDKMVSVVENATQTSKQLELHEILACFTTDMIANVAFGLESNSLDDPNSEFRKHGKEILDFDALAFLKFFFTSSFPNLSRKLHLTANKQSVIDFFYNTFKDNLEQRERSNVARKDFLQILLELKRSAALTVSELAAESFIFFLGGEISIATQLGRNFRLNFISGFETSSSVMTFTMYELALNREIQEKLREELRSGIESNEGKLSYDLLFQFKYLDMVVNETLRKYPPAFLITRTSTKEFKIPNTQLVIESGTDINISVLSLHRDPEYYPDPDRFDPERFTPENVQARKPFTFIPFGKEKIEISLMQHYFPLHPQAMDPESASAAALDCSKPRLESQR